MEWSGDATIGFNTDDTFFINHPLSGMDSTNEIACLNSPDNVWNNVVYILTERGEWSYSCTASTVGALYCTVTSLRKMLSFISTHAISTDVLLLLSYCKSYSYR